MVVYFSLIFIGMEQKQKRYISEENLVPRQLSWDISNRSIEGRKEGYFLKNIQAVVHCNKFQEPHVYIYYLGVGI